MPWFKHAHDYSGLNTHKRKVKIEIYSVYALPKHPEEAILSQERLRSKSIRLSTPQD